MGRKDRLADRTLADLLSQLGRLAHGEATADASLTPAQWTALRYFAHANRFSRTVSAFAHFHATTRGTASQTVKSLVQRGYLTRTRSPSDGRSARLDLTAKAEAILPADPFQRLVRAAGSLSSTARRAVTRSLERMLGELSQESGAPRFGGCARCRYLRGDGYCRQGKPPYECGLLSEPLEAAEIDQLCVNFDTR